MAEQTKQPDKLPGYIEPNKILVRYDAHQLMIGGGGAAQVAPGLGSGTSYNYGGWRDITEDQRTVANIPHFVSQGTYDRDIPRALGIIREFPGATILEGDQELGEKKAEGLEITIREGFMVSSAVVDTFFRNRMSTIKEYKTSLDRLRGSLTSAVSADEGPNISFLEQVARFEDQLKSRDGLYSLRDDYAAGLVSDSFRYEYQGRAGELMPVVDVASRYAEQAKTYANEVLAVRASLAELKGSDDYLNLVKFKSQRDASIAAAKAAKTNAAKTGDVAQEKKSSWRNLWGFFGNS